MGNRRRVMQLRNGKELLHSTYVQNKKHKKAVLYRWQHMYGKKYCLLLVYEFMVPMFTKKQLKRMNNQTDPTLTLRKLITEGFKEYDGDIREMALEVLSALESQYLNAASELRNANDSIVDLTENADDYKSEIIRLTNKIQDLEVELEEQKEINGAIIDEIDFGTGKLYYGINKGSVTVLNELMQAIKDAALVVPLTTITAHVRRSI